VAFGDHGDGHVRIGLVENRQRIRQAARNVKAFLSRYDKVLEESERRRAVAGE
jgi:alanine-synthesizing transaminase